MPRFFRFSFALNHSHSLMLTLLASLPSLPLSAAALSLSLSRFLVFRANVVQIFCGAFFFASPTRLPFHTPPASSTLKRRGGVKYERVEGGGACRLLYLCEADERREASKLGTRKVSETARASDGLRHCCPMRAGRYGLTSRANAQSRLRLCAHASAHVHKPRSQRGVAGDRGRRREGNSSVLRHVDSPRSRRSVADDRGRRRHSNPSVL